MKWGLSLNNFFSTSSNASVNFNASRTRGTVIRNHNGYPSPTSPTEEKVTKSINRK